MNEHLKTFLEFKAHTLRRVLSGELTMAKAHAMIQESKNQAKGSSSLSATEFDKEVQDTQRTFIKNIINKK